MLNDNFLNQLVYNMIKGAENMFMPFGMEINKLDVKFYDNSNFPLLGKTCAFFDLNEDTININIEDDFVKENTE